MIHKTLSRAVRLIVMGGILLMGLPFSARAQSESRITYAAGEPERHVLYTANPDGSSKTQLTKTGDSTSPAWSPDRSKIAFSSKRNEVTDIYIIDADGTNETQLTKDSGTYNDAPSWSPDGQSVAFVSNKSGKQDVYTIRADGTNIRRLTRDLTADFDTPAWSPDGTQIALASNKTDRSEIWLIDSSGQNLRQLTKHENGDFTYPAWSPDANTIAFASNDDGNGELYTVDKNGKNQRQITSVDKKYIGSVTWSPDGKSIAYMAWAEQQPHIIQITSISDGSARQISESANDVGWVSWASLKPRASTGAEASGAPASGDDPEVDTQPFTGDVHDLIPPLEGKVYEIKRGYNAYAYSQPSSGSKSLRRLLWGDRILWNGKTKNGFREVVLGNDTTAYIVNNASAYAVVDPATVTPDLKVNRNLRINDNGDGSHLRREASIWSIEKLKLRNGDVAKVIGGPVYAEYFIWWKLRTDSGIVGWRIDKPTWWEITR